MRVTIVPSDGVVVVNNEPRGRFDLSFMAGIHAVQWYDTWGEIERIDADMRHSNERITSIEPYQQAIELWQAWVAPADPVLPAVE